MRANARIKNVITDCQQMRGRRLLAARVGVQEVPFFR